MYSPQPLNTNLMLKTKGDDDYKPLVDLSDTISDTNNEKPENADRMQDGNGNIVKYDTPPYKKKSQ